ncbi:rhodanese-like domain-containing protein [Alteromonas sp. D210916BOD_24]|uniref:rhodanese-like domain-containing protein n=1 Tax=Alteromonas sp. D210916BOD_24 TaxID=3157618 RepID=UPI00399CAF9E
MLIDVKTRVENIDCDLRCITASLAAKEMKQNHGLLVDVREPGEVEGQPVEAALNIPRGVLEMKIIEKVTDPHHPIYLHCASGMRAKLAAEQLVKMGYENVTVITCPIPQINQANEE